MSNPLLSFEHRVLRRVRAAAPGRRWVVACSGGVDSMVLAEVVRRWRGRCCDRLVLAHVHHGRGPRHRDDARARVREFAREHRLPFVTNAPGPDEFFDEASLRRLRYAHLERWRRRYGCDVLCLAHHRDDLIETRVHRLIRGTGARGLRAMSGGGAERFRPLLDVSRAEIEAYARGRGLAWVEDPTNADVDGSFRAWLRGSWLPALERRAPGAAKSLARSLELLGESAVELEFDALAGIRRAAFAGLGHARRARLASEYLRALGAIDHGRAHVLELLKRLDTDRKDFTFEMLGLEFHVSEALWWASRVCQ